MKLDAGFTLIEIAVTMAILGILAAMAIPSYTSYIDKTNSADVAADFASIQLKLEMYFAANGQYPETLDEIGLDGEDPWGKPYKYLSKAADDISAQRKFSNGDPINTDYDLYSKGPDTNKGNKISNSKSLDDIIRADNGKYIGIAADY